MYDFHTTSLIQLLILAAISTVLASPAPSPQISGAANANSGSAPAIHCFRPSEPRARTADIDLCAAASSTILTRDGGTEFLIRQPFYYGPDPIEHVHNTPDVWPLQQGLHNCEIVLANGLPGAKDVFRLVDVQSVADRIIEKCLKDNKFGLGGFASVGNERGFFVSVNGVEGNEGVAAGRKLSTYNEELSKIGKVESS